MRTHEYLAMFTGKEESGTSSAETYFPSHEQAITYLLREIDHRDVRVVGVEPPPMYEFPSTDFAHHSQQHESTEFQQGMYFTQRLIDTLQTSPKINVTTWMMIDDVTNVHGVRSSESIAATFSKIHASLRRSLPFVQGSPERTFLESDMKAASKKRFSADAVFQLQKLKGTSGNYLGFKRDIFLPRSMLIVVHPIDFWQQQGIMLGELLGEMKKDELFQKIPRIQRRIAIEQAYRHVWIDAAGNVALLTRPVFEGSVFKFAPVDFTQGV